MSINPTKVLNRLASVELTLVCIGFAMVLVLIGTLAQVNMGTFAAQKAYFNSWWIFTDALGNRIPFFPGGLSIGMAWMVNLIAAFFLKFQLSRKHIGVLISHFGVILLLLGQFVTQMTAKESNMPIEVGQTSNFSESFRDIELAIVNTSNPDSDEVTSIPYARFHREGPIPTPHLPFTLHIRKFYPNAELQMATGEGTTGATQGVGTRISVREIPVTHSDDEANTVTALVEVMAEGKSLGAWLLSSGLGRDQSFVAQGKSYALSIRHKRQYYPFSLTLKEFRHDRYLGTDIPKNFSSLVQLSNSKTGETREALIYMNNPLRYEGKTFYQASFGKGDKLSVFQVVENPVAWAPYLSCALVILGLAIQFMMHLLAFLQKRI